MVAYIKNYIEKSNNIILTEEQNVLLNDYVEMALLNKRNVSINISSMRKLRERHDDEMHVVNNKGKRIVKLAKDSKFNELRKLLPNEFEQIKTANRLKAEGIIMHHCVYSYADKITRDKCAIYSLLYEPDGKRYTIEFICQKDKYKIRQIQGQCNKGCPPEVREYVNSFLNV